MGKLLKRVSYARLGETPGRIRRKARPVDDVAGGRFRDHSLSL